MSDAADGWPELDVAEAGYVDRLYAMPDAAPGMPKADYIAWLRQRGPVDKAAEIARIARLINHSGSIPTRTPK